MVKNIATEQESIASGTILSVTDLTRQIKLLLEEGVTPSWIRGEVSNLRQQSSGHTYFTLKDENSQISCALFKGDARQQTVVIQEGKQLLVFGELSVFEPRGTYQLIVRFILEDGLGRLKLEFERLKEKLAAEGLFDPARKKQIPLLPKKIGFITSPTGAAIRDFISILRRRDWSGTVIVIPALVQGAEAATQMIEQLEQAERIDGLDLIVIGRGGGSLEDMWCFNDERLVRAVASCAIPIISAVGHEIDFVLTDFAADKRAETPSAAAELISSGYVELNKRLHLLREKLAAYSPKKMIEQAYLRLDDCMHRLNIHFRDFLFAHHRILSNLLTRWHGIAIEGQFKQYQLMLDHLKSRLESSHWKKILERGFVMVTSPDGKPISTKQSLRIGDHLKMQFADGEVGVEVEKV